MDKHIGSDFDAFLEEEGMREEVTAAAVKRVIAWQFARAMKAQKVSKTEMAARMHTSRMVVNRLLDEKDTSVTLATLARASVALGASLHFELGTGSA
jgi:antitoxin HicB